MNMKIIGKILLAIAFLYFVAGVWGWYNNHGVPGAIVGTFILALFIGGVWCLTAMGRTKVDDYSSLSEYRRDLGRLLFQHRARR